VQAGARSRALVGLQDLAHTYVDVGGAAAMPHPDGRSLVPLFRDPNPSGWRDHILCAYYGGEFLYTQRMAITGRYKYMFNGFDWDEMYDLERDPDEMENIAYSDAHKAQADDMRARLYELMEQFDDPYRDGRTAHRSDPAPDRYGAVRYLPRGKRI